MRAVNYIFIFLTALCGLARGAEPYFDQGKEFPNYLLPKEYRGLPPDQVPASVVLRARAEVEAAVASYFDRLVVPMAGGAQAEPYLAHLEKAISANYPADLLPSGGVVRSVITKVYWEIARGEKAGRTREQVLSEIARSQKPVFIHELQGKGSDFDLQLRVAEEHYAEASAKVNTVLNAELPKFQVGQEEQAILRSLVPQIDVTRHQDRLSPSGSVVTKGQFNEAKGQGGATADMMAYDPANRKIIDPGGNQYLDEIVRGRAVHLAPVDAMSAEKLRKQAVRGVRVMLEMPWLQFTDAESERVMRSDIQALKTFVEQGGSIDQATREAINKLWRNSPEAGANNRFYRAKEGSLDHLIFETSKVLEKKQFTPMIPEYVPHLEVGRPASAPPDLVNRRFDHDAILKSVNSHLMERQNFEAKHTNKGELLHGTPSFDGALTIVGGNILLSREGHGGAMKGRGAYFTSLTRVAQEYAEQNGSKVGVVVPLKLVPDARLRILDWQEFSRTPEGRDLFEKYKMPQDKLDRVFEVLADHYGIDVIVNGFVLVQNSNALQFPEEAERFRFLLDSYESRVRNDHLDPELRVSALDTYKKMYRYGQDTKQRLGPPLDEIKIAQTFARDATEHANAGHRLSAAKALNHLLPQLPQALRLQMLTRLMNGDDYDVRKVAGPAFLDSMPKEVAQRRSWLLEGNNLHTSWRAAAGTPAEANWGKMVAETWQGATGPELDAIVRVARGNILAEALRSIGRSRSAFDKKPESPLTHALIESAAAWTNKGGSGSPPPFMLERGVLHLEDMRRLKLDIQALRQLHPIDAAASLEWLVRRDFHPVHLDPQAYQAQLADWLARHPELGTLQDWLGVSADIEARLKRLIENSHPSFELQPLYAAAMQLPTVGMSFLEKEIGNADKLSNSKALALVAALREHGPSNRFERIQELLGQFSAHPNSEVRQKAVSALAGGLYPNREDHTATVQALSRFSPTDQARIFSHFGSGYDGPDSQIGILRKQGPSVWADGLSHAITSGQVDSDLFRAAHEITQSGDAKAALKVAEALLDHLAKKGEWAYAPDTMEAIQEVAKKFHEAADFAEASRPLIAKLQQHLPAASRVGQGYRRAFGSALFHLGVKDGTTRTLALQHAEAAQDKKQRAENLVALVPFDKAIGVEVSERLHDLRERESPGPLRTHLQQLEDTLATMQSCEVYSKLAPP